MGISPNQFSEMQSRVRNPKGSHPPRAPDIPPRANIVMGLDPSLRGTGWGVIRICDGKPRVAECGTIRCPASWSRTRCLGEISNSLRQVMKTHQPEICAVEALFYAQNLKTALILGEARGAALSVVAQVSTSIYEIAPRKVKQAIVGFGGAQKSAVAKMVQRMTGVVELPDPDAADALAVALVYWQEAGRPITGAMKRL